jgi:hypothetical protein
MQIKSDFHDYYDVAMAQGQDTTLVYRRYPKSVYNEYAIPYSGSGGGYSRPIYFDYRTIGFCGKLYPLVVVDLESSMFYRTAKEIREKRKFCYKIEDIDSFVRENFKDEEYSEYEDPKDVFRFQQKNWKAPRRRDFVRHFDEFKAKYQNYKRDIFEKEYCPIFFTGESRYNNEKKMHERPTIFNGCLKDLEFFRLFDPHQAFQEISMFLGSLAEPRKPVPHITEEDMCEIKGFNRKTSFRQDPSKKKTTHKKR